MGSIDAEIYLASAVHFLFQAGEKEAAQLLLSCYAEIWSDYGDFNKEIWIVELSGSQAFYDAYEDQPTRKSIDRAIKAVLPYIEGGVWIRGKAALVEFDTDWRVRLLAQGETQNAHNQNSYAKEPIIYEGMRFSSKPEVAIAKALDKLGIMYLPNCLIRVGSIGNRLNRFPDFLICYTGKWGILEIDGKAYHTGRATEDHERSRLIERHGGVAYFTRFDSKRCMNDPDGVVKEFLEILANK